MKKGIILGLGLMVSASAISLAETNIQSVSLNNGINIKASKILPKQFSDQKILANRAKTFSPTLSRVNYQDGASLDEDFEGVDFSVDGWLPDGWYIISESEEGLGDSQKWNIDMGDGFNVITPEGNYGATISFGADMLEQDERLVTPFLNIRPNDELSFMLFSSPIFFYDLSHGTLDYQTGEFIGDKILKGDLTVEVREEGGDWQQIWSMMEYFDAFPVMQLLYYNDVESFTISLSEFEGKRIEIAFRYKAKDAHTVMIDAVRVGFSQLQGISYSLPKETLYWGMDRSKSWMSLNFTVAQYPVYSPITWTNYSAADCINYQWDYIDPITKDWTISKDDLELSVTYFPDYSSELTCRNNMYEMPVLKGSAENAVDASFTSDVPYFQAGGKPEFMATGYDDEQFMLEMGLLPFDLNKYDLNFMVADFDKVNDHAVPVFGHNSNTGALWLNYLVGSNPQPGDDVQLNGILNWMYPTDSPLVVTGAHVLAFGKDIDPSVEFKVEIVPVDEAGSFSDASIASASCKANDMMRNPNTGLPYEMFNILFDFSEPVIIDNSYPAYAVRFTGFNNDQVGTFIPVQSYLPDENGVCMGFVETSCKIDGATQYTTSYIPMSDIEGEFGPCYNAFAINIDGFYPWLDTPEEVTVPIDGAIVEVPIGTYYEGSELTFSNIAGLDVTATGRYNNCILSVRRNNTDEQMTNEFTITAPGVSKSVKVKEGPAGIETISSSNKGIEAIYSLDGIKVDRPLSTSGLYIIRYTNGQTRKVKL